MSGGEVAALIAAGAFLILVLFLVLVLVKISKVMGEVQQTVIEANKSVESITKDVNVLSGEVEGLLVKSNVLLEDVNGKVATLDPLFTAIADLSESVSDLNDSSRNLVGKVTTVTKNTAKASVMARVSSSVLKMYKKRQKQTEE